MQASFVKLEDSRLPWSLARRASQRAAEIGETRRAGVRNIR